METQFLEQLFSEEKNYNSVLLTKRKYDSLIEDVKEIKACKRKKSSRDYRIMQRYDVLDVQGCEKLIEPMSDAQSSVKYFVHAGELFDILYSTHVASDHGGRDKMLKQLNTLYKNITQAQVRMFLDLCEPCKQKQRGQQTPRDASAKGRLVEDKPVTLSHFITRRSSQVDIIDYQSQPDEKFNFLLVHQDQLTKFVTLKPLTSKRALEVADNLLDIFLLFGAPSILRSGNGHAFCKEIIKCLTQLRPEIKIKNGESRPRRSKSQGSVERAYEDIENMLTTYMAENQTNKWSEGVRFVQFMKNRAYNSAINRSPYEAMFGCPAKVQLSPATVPQNVLQLEHSCFVKFENLLDAVNMESNVTEDPLSSASSELLS